MSLQESEAFGELLQGEYREAQPLEAWRKCPPWESDVSVNPEFW